jgi:hypothetical protein
MSAEAAAFAHAQAFLLKAHMALAQAATEAQIIAALVLCTDPQARLRLLYLDLDASGVPLRATVVASWRDGDHGTVIHCSGTPSRATSAA